MSAPPRWNDPKAFTLTPYRELGFAHKTLEGSAKEASKLHPRVFDWIEAAPIIACAVRVRHFQGLYELALHGGRVPDALRIVGVPTCMRKQTIEQVDDWCARPIWMTTFPLIPESELAQMLARMQGLRRSEWLTRIAYCIKKAPRNVPAQDFTAWAVRMAEQNLRPDLDQAMDFMRDGGNPFDLKWSMKRFKHEHDRWVTRMLAQREMEAAEALRFATALMIQERAKAAAVLDIVTDYAPLPLCAKIDGVRFTALDTPRKLLDEGAAMHHCIGSPQFLKAMQTGACRYYHLENAAGVKSTLELHYRRDGWSIGQHCGPLNRPPESMWPHAVVFVQWLNEETAPARHPAEFIYDARNKRVARICPELARLAHRYGEERGHERPITMLARPKMNLSVRFDPMADIAEEISRIDAYTMCWRQRGRADQWTVRITDPRSLKAYLESYPELALTERERP